MHRFILALLMFSMAWAVYDVTSNTFDLDLSTNMLILSGDVKMGNRGYLFSADSSQFNIDAQNLFIPESFQINNKSQTISGSHLEISNLNSDLTAREMNMSFQKYRITGRNVRAAKSVINMNKVQITSCRGNPPVVFLNSEEVLLYPQWGFFVAFNSVFYIKGVPVFYFPAYFMGDRRQDMYSQHHLLPEVGSNPLEGGFVKGDIPYYVNESNHGAARVAYIEKQGMQLGVQHYSIFQEGQALASTALFYSPKMWQGHISYRRALFNDFEREQDALGFLFNAGMVKIKQSNVYFTAGWHENEIINNQYVSQKPRYALESVLGITEQDNINMSVEQANIVENQLTVNQRTSWAASWQSIYPLGWGDLSQVLQYISTYYGSSSQQQRLQQNWVLTIPFEVLSIISDYEHLYAFNGTSPFMYDQYQVDPFDKIGLALKIGLGPFDFETRWRKRVDQDYYYSRRVQLSLPYEKCLEFSIYWEDVNKSMGVEIRL